jgi:agmatine deiminase
MCRAIAGADGAERVNLLVLNEIAEAQARRALGDCRVELVPMPYGDIWLRDTGPVFVAADGALSAACFSFNGWGGRYLFEHDPLVSARIAELAKAPTRRYPAVIEGGALEADGAGTIITTKQCLLNPNRNPSLDQSELESTLRESLGAERIVWLDRGLINDHTDGHVDTLARFVAPGRVVCMEPVAADPNRDALIEIRQALISSLDAAGNQLEVATIPSPGRVENRDGQLLPASYLNFFIANSVVVVPVYGSDHDDDAVAALEPLFPDRRVIGIDAHALVCEGGAFHCITQEQPVWP